MSANSAEFKKLDKQLKRLGDRGYRKVVRKASAKAATPMVRAIRKRAKGSIKKGIAKKTKTYNNGTIFTIIGVSGPHGHLLEFGHRLVAGGTIARLRGGKTPKAADPSKTGQGHVVGHVRAHPFVRPAWDEGASKMQSKLTAELEAGIVKESSK